MPSVIHRRQDASTKYLGYGDEMEEFESSEIETDDLDTLFNGEPAKKNGYYIHIYYGHCFIRL